MNDDGHNMWELPRRYEETKPAISQAFTHNAIISIGNKLSAEEGQRHAEDLRAAVDECEKNTWEKAEVYKNECVKKALDEAKVLEERKINNMQRKHNKELKHELDRLESYLLHQTEERLSEQLSDSNRKFTAALDDLRSVSQQEKNEAVEAARQEEQTIAQDNLTETQRLHELALEAQHQADVDQKVQEMGDFKAQHEQEKISALLENTRHHENILEENINSLNEAHSSKLTELQDVIANLSKSLEATKLELVNMTALKNSYVAKLIHNKEAFTKFIEAARPDFHQEQSDFLIQLNEVQAEDDPRLQPKN